MTAYFTVRDHFGTSVFEAKSIYGRLPGKILEELRQSKNQGKLVYRNEAAFEVWATQAAAAVSGAAVPIHPNLEDLRKLFADDTPSQDSDPAFSLGPTRNAEILADRAAETRDRGDPETQAPTISELEERCTTSIDPTSGFQRILGTWKSSRTSRPLFQTTEVSLGPSSGI